MKQVLKKCFEPLFYKRLWLFALEDVLMSFCLLLPSFQRNFGRFLEYAWNTALALPPEFFVARKINRRTFYIDLRFKLDVVCIVLCCYLSSPKTLLLLYTALVLVPVGLATEHIAPATTIGSPRPVCRAFSRVKVL